MKLSGENIHRLKAVNYFRKNAPSWMFDRVLNTPLNHLFDLAANYERIMSEAQLANICSNSTIKIPAVEAVARRCSVKNVFLKNSQNSQENTCVGVSFLIKLKA